MSPMSPEAANHRVLAFSQLHDELCNSQSLCHRQPQCWRGHDRDVSSKKQVLQPFSAGEQYWSHTCRPPPKPTTPCMVHVHNPHPLSPGLAMSPLTNEACKDRYRLFPSSLMSTGSPNHRVQQVLSVEGARLGRYGTQSQMMDKKNGEVAGCTLPSM